MVSNEDSATVWQSVYYVMNLRSATKCGSDVFSKSAEAVVESYHDAELEAYMESAVKTALRKIT